MADGFKSNIIYLLLFGLFVIALINVGVYLAAQNGANQSILDDDSLASYKSSLQENLTQSYSDISSSNTVLENSSITTTTSIPFFSSTQGIWKTVKTIPITVYNLTIGLAMKKIFGDSAGLVTAVISAIMIIIILFGVVAWIATGVSK